MDKYQNKYRIPSARLQTWDYRWAGAYFITICTAGRKHFFGEIVKTGHALSQNKMQLSHVGVIADILWYEIPNHTKNAELGAFVVMPNHIHGILVLTENGVENITENGIDDGNDRGNDDGNDDGNVETGHALSLQTPQTPQTIPSQQPIQPPQTPQSSEQSKTIGQKRFQNIGKNSVSSIIGSYKSAVTKNANRLGFDHAWQSRFHDHIIRSDDEYQRIVNYINTNPENWDQDIFFKSGKS